MSAPLAGVRVVEYAQYVAGPFAGSLLAELGAEVTRSFITQSSRWRCWRAPRRVVHRVEKLSSTSSPVSGLVQRTLQMLVIRL